MPLALAPIGTATLYISVSDLCGICWVWQLSRNSWWKHARRRRWKGARLSWCLQQRTWSDTRMSPAFVHVAVIGTTCFCVSHRNSTCRNRLKTSQSPTNLSKWLFKCSLRYFTRFMAKRKFEELSTGNSQRVVGWQRCRKERVPDEKSQALEFLSPSRACAVLTP